MAAEYQSMHGALTNGGTPQLNDSISMQDAHLSSAEQLPVPAAANHVHDPGLGESLDSLAAFLDNEPLSLYHFSSLFNTEQPMPFFSPESFSYGHDLLPQTTPAASILNHGQHQQDELHSFSRFGSRLPSLQPEDSHQIEGSTSHPLAEVTIADRQKIVDKLNEFSNVIPFDFKLPTRLALCRYIAAYVNGFHEHMPFLHVPTMSVDSCSIELILAIAAVGAQYTFEGEKGVDIFNASRAIATHRIRRRDARLVEYHRRADSDRSSSHEVDGQANRSPPRTCSTVGPLGLPSESELSLVGEDLMQTAQALLLLMALCTWAKHKEILREALAIQSILATLIRDDGLQLEAVCKPRLLISV
jgi:hypothetical protein